MIPPRSTAAEEANNLSSRRLLAGPSIYFRTNKFQAFYEDDEKKIIFQIVLPEEFIDDFAHGLLQNESYLYMLQKRLYDMELQQSKQLQLLNKLLENATLTQVSTASRDVVTSQQEDDYSQYYGVNHQQQSYVQHNPYGPQQQQQQQHYY
jgi:hypothetical protein